VAIRTRLLRTKAMLSSTLAALVLVATGATSAACGSTQNLQFPPARSFGKDSVVLAADGTKLAQFPADNADHMPLKFEEYPDALKQAVIATEDPRFYQHDGVDYSSIPGAVAHNRGASTLTMQWVQITYLDVPNRPRDRSISRKILQGQLARKLEQDLKAQLGSKEAAKHKILTDYLSDVYLCRGTGFERASHGFFGKSLSKLSLGQIATLAAIIKDPCNYVSGIVEPDQTVTDANGHTHVVKGHNWPQELLERRNNYVLVQMLKHGDITQGQYDQATREEIKFTPYNGDGRSRYDSANPRVADLVYLILQQIFPKTDNTAEGWEAMLARGGLTIKTTLNAGMMKTLEDAVRRNLPNPGLVAGVTILDENGNLAAFYGGDNRTFAKDKFNYAIYGPGRNGGSTSKVFTLTDFEKEGYSAASQINTPNTFPTDQGPIPNAPNIQPGVHTVTECTIISSNTCFLELITGDIPGGGRLAPDYRVNPGTVGQLIDDLGGKFTLVNGSAQPTFDANPMLTLTATMTTLERDNAFSTVMRHGIRKDPRLVTEVDAESGVIYQPAAPQPRQVIKPVVADNTLHVLGQVHNGTARGLELPGGRETADKSGTGGNAQGDTDLTFLKGTGYTPGKMALFCSAWMGYPDKTRVLPPHSGSISPGKVCRDFLAAVIHGPNIPLAPSYDPNYGEKLTAK
jgi:membrane peptidoglycan carboxypeptidase